VFARVVGIVNALLEHLTRLNDTGGIVILVQQTCLKMSMLRSPGPGVSIVTLHWKTRTVLALCGFSRLNWVTAELTLISDSPLIACLACLAHKQLPLFVMHAEKHAGPGPLYQTHILRQLCQFEVGRSNHMRDKWLRNFHNLMTI
jgi:hypothetical protein